MRSDIDLNIEQDDEDACQVTSRFVVYSSRRGISTSAQSQSEK